MHHTLAYKFASLGFKVISVCFFKTLNANDLQSASAKCGGGDDKEEGDDQLLFPITVKTKERSD